MGTATATAIGLVLTLAGVAKLRDPAGMEPFLRAVGLRGGVRDVVWRAVPAGEVVAGAWLVSGIARVAAAACACVLAFGFVCALVIAVLRGVAEPCRCFGTLDRSASHRVSLARATAVLGGAALALGGGGAGAALPARAAGLAFAVCGVAAFALLSEVSAFRAGVRRELSGEQVR